jgi:hypothetical protein
MTTDFDFSLDLLTKIVGVLGFLLSLYVFYVNRADKRPQLKIEIFHEVAYSDERDDYGFPSPPDDGVIITIYNSALIRARLVSLKVEYGSKRNRNSKDIFLDDSPFAKPPLWVEPHDKISLGADMESFSMWLNTDFQDNNIEVVGTISSGKSYRSNKMKHNSESVNY